MGLAALRRIQAGKETTSGTAVAATAKWMGMTLGGSLKDREIVQPTDQRASLAAAHRSYTPSTLWEDKLEGEVTFEDIIMLLSMAVVGGVTPSTVDTSAKLWTFTPSMTAGNTPDTFTVEFGDNVQAYEAEYVFAKSLEIAGAEGEALKFAADIVGRQLTATTFTGSLADRSVESALVAKTKIYMDDTGGTIGTTQKTATLIDWTWRLPAHFVPKRHQDGNLYFTAFSELAMQPELELLCEFVSGVATLRTKYTGETRQLVRLKTEGSLVGAVSALKYLQIDGAYKITEFDVLDERDGRTIVRLTLKGEYDATYAKLFEVLAQSAVTAIP